MKKYIFSIICLITFFISAPSYSQDYFYTDLYKAKKKAKEENKRLFVDFSAVWCGPCKMMETNVFPDPKVKSFLTDTYVCVKLMHGENKILFSKYKINSFPTFIIMDYKGKEVYRWSGFSPKKEFLQKLEKVPVDNEMVEKFDSLYEFNKKNVDFLKEYLLVLSRNNYYDKEKKISKEILKYDKNWMKKSNLELILWNIDDKKYFKYLMEHKQTFYDSLPIPMVDYQLFMWYLQKHYSRDINDDYINVRKIKDKMAKLFHPDNVEKYTNEYLFVILNDRTDPKLNRVFVASGIRFLQLAKNILKTEFFSLQIESVLYKLKTKPEFIQMKKAFDFQFSNDPEEIYLPYYDYKAFVEYMLNDKEAYINTIKRANEISVKTTGHPFRSRLKNMIVAYKLVNPGITPETLK